MANAGRLQGLRVMVTRAREQAMPLIELFEADGAEVVVCPTILIEPPSNPRVLEDAVSRLRSFDWLLFTSVNGVQAFLRELRRHHDTTVVGAVGDLQLAAVGPATAAEIEEAGFDVACLPGTIAPVARNTDVKTVGHRFDSCRENQISHK